MARESWWLKLDRAEKHFKEFEREVRRYADTNPYRAVRDPPPAGQERIWRYRLELTENPDPKLGLIVGDVIHNLRSALDHLAVALVPSNRRSKASFPMFDKDIWLREGRRYISRDRQRRRGFRTAVQGMNDEAVALIKALQPYNLQQNPHYHPLGIISRLDNADKHRQLILTAAEIREASLRVTVDRKRVPESLLFGVVRNGTVIAEFSAAPDAEVDLRIAGTVSVAMNVGANDPYPEAIEALRYCFGIGTMVFPALEPFVRT